MKTPVFTGSSTAIVTPFTEEGVNFPKLGELIDFQVENGSSAIIVCGTTGESSTQSIEEHIETMDFCVRHVAGRIKVVAGCGSNDTRATLDMSLAAQRSGADALLLVTPYYNKANQQGLIQHFLHIADRVEIPIILYNVPARTTVSFTADTYKVLSKHPRINGVKEASGDFGLIASTRALCGDDLFIWSGNDNHTVPMMALGAKGLVSVAGNIMPRQMANMCAAALAGDFQQAAEIQVKYDDVFSGLFMDINPIPVKAAMNLMGMEVGSPRMPLCDLSPAYTEQLRAILGAHDAWLT